MTDKVCWAGLPGTTTVGLLLLTGRPGRAEISTDGGPTWYLSAGVRCTVSSRRDLGGLWLLCQLKKTGGELTQCGNLQSFWKLALRVWRRWRLVTRVWGGEYLLHCDDNEDLSLDQGGGEEWVLVTPKFTMEGKCIYLQSTVLIRI